MSKADFYLIISFEINFKQYSLFTWEVCEQDLKNLDHTEYGDNESSAPRREIPYFSIYGFNHRIYVSAWFRPLILLARDLSRNASDARATWHRTEFRSYTTAYLSCGFPRTKANGKEIGSHFAVIMRTGLSTDARRDLDRRQNNWDFWGNATRARRD